MVVYLMFFMPNIISDLMRPKIFAIDIDGTITDTKGGRVDLDALAALRYMEKLGHKVIFVTGRSSVEAYVLSVFGGTTRVSVGENGGAVTCGPSEHKLLGKKDDCVKAFEFLKTKIPQIEIKNVFPRMTEVVLERNFDIDLAKKIVTQNELSVGLSDSQYAFHINSKGINKARGLEEVMKMFSATKDDVISIGDSETDIPLFRATGLSIAIGNASEDVKSQASMTVRGNAGDGVIEALEYVELKLSRE